MTRTIDKYLPKGGNQPYKRTLLRSGPSRNVACLCGSGKKAKQCCMRKVWPKNEANWPNDFGSYDPTVAEEKRAVKV